MTPDDYTDLEWYFGGGREADEGIRSVQGGIEDALRRMELCAPGAAGDMRVRETRCGGSDLAGSERMLDAAARDRRIGVRLGLMCEGNPRRNALCRRVLELQHGDTHRIHGLSLALLCSTHAARRGFAVALAHAPGKLSTESIRAWVIWVASRDSAAEVWEPIEARANRWTREAWKEYENARLG